MLILAGANDRASCAERHHLVYLCDAHLLLGQDCCCLGPDVNVCILLIKADDSANYPVPLLRQVAVLVQQSLKVLVPAAQGGMLGR